MDMELFSLIGFVVLMLVALTGMSGGLVLVFKGLVGIAQDEEG